MYSRVAAALAVTLLNISSAMAQATVPDATTGGLEHMFWSGIEALHLTFRAIGTLSGGPDRGAVWQFDVRSHTRMRIGTATALAWPVQGANPQIVFALREGEVVEISLPDGGETKVGSKAPWRKLIGVAPDDTILGLVQDASGARPALLTRGGELSILPAGASDADRKRISLLLQEDRPYSADRRLVVARSERGGRGFDVYYVADGGRLNASDCGDDACGQPSLSLDESRILYIRDAQ